MITRAAKSLKGEVAFNQNTFDASCGGWGATSTGYLGRIIDRQGLGRSFNSVLVHIGANADIGTTTLDAAAVSVGAFLYHSSTTCADDFDRLSTGSEAGNQPLFVVSNTTSTLASGYMATSTSVGTFGVWSATSTGTASGDYFAAYSLAPAQRFLRVLMTPEVHASSSGGSKASIFGDLIFSAPDEAPPTTTSTSRSFVTS